MNYLKGIMVNLKGTKGTNKELFEASIFKKLQIFLGKKRNNDTLLYLFVLS